MLLINLHPIINSLLFRLFLVNFFLVLIQDVTILKASTIEGIVFSDKGPLSNAIVFAYPDYNSLSGHSNFISSSRGEKIGQFTLSLNPGKYYLVAKGSLKDNYFYAYHGLNPIIVTQEPMWIPFFTVPVEEVRHNKDGQGIQGIVTFKNKPVTGGTVSVYSTQDRTFRGMGLLTNSLDDQGNFHFDLDPGSYVVVARKRQQDSGMGPISKKDFFCYPSANPIRVLPNQLSSIEIGCYPRDDLETYLNKDGIDPRGKKMIGRRTASLEGTELNVSPGSQDRSQIDPTVISGKITNLNGIPQNGLFVSAYPAGNNTLFQMHLVRLITENITRTDENGSYSLSLISGGTYFLVAREVVGEAPNRNEYYGLYEGNSNHSIVLSTGERLDNINIFVDKIMP